MTPRQQRFVEEYLLDLNATQAAIRAGYSRRTAKSQGQRLLTNVDVATAIQRAQADRTTRTGVAQDQVIEALAAIAFSDIRSYFDEHGCQRSAGKLDPRAAAALASLEVKELLDSAATVTRLKLWDKVKALELLGRHLGMWNDKLNLCGQDGAPLIVELVQFGQEQA